MKLELRVHLPEKKYKLLVSESEFADMREAMNKQLGTSELVPYGIAFEKEGYKMCEPIPLVHVPDEYFKHETRCTLCQKEMTDEEKKAGIDMSYGNPNYAKIYFHRDCGMKTAMDIISIMNWKLKNLGTQNLEKTH